MNFTKAPDKPFYKKKPFIIIGVLVFLVIIGKTCGSDKNTESKTVENKTEVAKPKILKEITAYTENPYTKEGYENIKTYYYGLYISLPKDTTGVVAEVKEFLKAKAENVGDNEVVHLWIFSDSTVVPKSFDGEWSTQKSRQKCFAHAAKLANGNCSYDYDIFGEFKS